MLGFNISNPGINIPGLLTSQEQGFVTDLASQSYVEGDMLYVDNTGKLVRLPRGIVGQALIMTTTVPEWGVVAASVTDGDYGDVTISAGGTVITIDNQAVTRNKLEHIQSGHFLGRHGAGTSDVQEVSPTQARTILSINNVDNTSDLNKPVSTATQTALDLKANDADVVKIAGAQIINGEKTFTDTLFTLQDDADNTKKARFNVSTTATGTTTTHTLPATSATLLNTNNTATVTSKTISLGSNTITGTKAQFNTAVTDGDFMYVGDAPTAHTHVISDTAGLQAELNNKVSREVAYYYAVAF